MKKIKLSYNPSKMSVSLLDGEASFEKEGLLGRIQGKHLQEWIVFFPRQLAEALGEEQYELFFYGSQSDYKDVEYWFKRESKYKPIRLTHAKLIHVEPLRLTYTKAKVREQEKQNQIKLLLNEILKVREQKKLNQRELKVNETKKSSEQKRRNQIILIVKEIQGGLFRQLNNTNVKKMFHDVLNEEFEVNVVATMSSGNETKIKAMLGRELMPSRNQACTAIVTRITDDNRDSDTFDAVHYNQAHEEIEKFENVNLEKLKEWNEDAETGEIGIAGNIPFTESKKIKLQLVDTPGPNSDDKNHSKKTYENLEKSEKQLIIYVLNGTQIGTNDDYTLLKHICDSMKGDRKKLSNRFVFVVNKLDEFDPNKEPIGEVLNNVKNYLKLFGIEDPNVFAVSARGALNIRKTAISTNSFKQIVNLGLIEEMSFLLEIEKNNRIRDHHFETYAQLDSESEKDIQTRLSNAKENNDAKEEALIHSGIPSLEAWIDQYLNKYVIPKKIKTIVDVFEAEIEEQKVEIELENHISLYQFKKKYLNNKIESIKVDIHTLKRSIGEKKYQQSDSLIGNLEEILDGSNNELNELDEQLKILKQNKEWLINTKNELENLL